MAIDMQLMTRHTLPRMSMLLSLSDDLDPSATTTIAPATAPAMPSTLNQPCSARHCNVSYRNTSASSSVKTGIAGCSPSPTQHNAHAHTTNAQTPRISTNTSVPTPRSVP
jgi:hypothetical protein